MRLDKTGAISFCVIFFILSLLTLLISISSLINLCFPSCINLRKSSQNSDTITKVKNHSKNEMNSKIKCTTIVVVISSSFCVCVSFIMMIIVSINESKWNEWKILGPIALFFYSIGRWTMLYSFVIRLDITFKNSVYQYKPLIIIILNLFLIIIGLSVFVVVFAHLPLQWLLISDKIAYKIRYYGAQIFGILELIFSVLLLFLFIKRLFSLFSMSIKQSDSFKQRQNSVHQNNESNVTETATTITTSHDDVELQIHSENDDNNNNNNNNDNNNNIDNFDDILKQRQRQRQISVDSLASNMEKTEMNVDKYMLFAMTKYTLLASIVIISSTLSLSISVLINQSYFIFILLGIDAFITAFCMYLFNAFSKHIYLRICKYPHKGCRKCCLCCMTISYFCRY